MLVGILKNMSPSAGLAITYRPTSKCAATTTLLRPSCLHCSGGQALGCWLRLHTASSSTISANSATRYHNCRNIHFSLSGAYLKDEHIMGRQRKTRFRESLIRRAQLALSQTVQQPPVLCCSEGAVIKFDHQHLGLFAPLWMDGESCNICFRKNHNLMISEGSFTLQDSVWTSLVGTSPCASSYVLKSNVLDQLAMQPYSWGTDLAPVNL